MEYVYALHDFQPEAEDEIPFRAGEKIEVIEKDDEYGDGWWQGKNASGKIGLFPQSYTTSQPPASSTKPPTEPSLAAAIAAPQPITATAALPVAEDSIPDTSSTSTPLESLREESEPPTPAVTHTPTIPPIHVNDQEEEGSAQGNGHQMMQATITDVQKAIEQLGRNNSSTFTNTDTQSISFASDTGGETTDFGEDSDADRDSGGDVDGGEGWHRDARLRLAKKARKAVEEAEKLESMINTRSAAPPIEVEMSDDSDFEDDSSQRDFTMSSFARRHSKIPEEDEEDTESDKAIHEPLPAIQEPEVEPRTETPVREVFVAPPPVAASLPTPAASEVNTLDAAQRATSPSVAPSSKHNSVASEPAAASPSPGPDAAGQPKKPTGDPSGWTMEEVVQWLASKGFGDDVCEKFTEQEITGDVLLDLDVNLLKNEIGIMAYGKRVRIAHAITDLRRPPSLANSERNAPPSPLMPPSNTMSAVYPNSPKSLTYSYHSRSQSLSQSIAGTRSSLGTPFTPLSPEHSTDASSTRGLGIEGLPGSKGLMTSPSDSNLGGGETKTLVSDKDPSADDRGAFSEGETMTTASIHKRRRLFGRSHDSGASSNGSPRNSKDGLSPTTPTSATADSPKQLRPKKVNDSASSTKGNGERLSIFGVSTSSLGVGSRKARKPAPRYSSTEDGTLTDAKDKEKSSSFLRFGSSSSKSGKNGRPSTAEGAKNGADLRQRSVSNVEALSASQSRSPDGDTTPRKDSHVLRKRTTSYPGAASGDSPTTPTKEHPDGSDLLKPGQSVLKQIGESDHSGWMMKRGDRYNSWKSRYFVLKGQHLYCLKSSSSSETKIKGYINILGYRVTVDEALNPGKYGFKIDHEQDKTHYFSHEEKSVMREWMKAIMKATIGRDYSRPVISSVNIPTIPLLVAQAMNPAPRPPSPTQRAATQKAMRRENPNQLSSRDARVLMGASGEEGKERAKLDTVFTESTVDSSSSIAPTTPRSSSTPKFSSAPPRPSREQRRNSEASVAADYPVDDNLIQWANGHLPVNLQLQDSSRGPLFGGLALLRLAESIKGRPTSPAVPDSLFPTDPNDDKLDGLFKLFDFLLDNDVKMGSLSINDIRQGKRDKVVQLLKALKAWEEKRKAIAQSIGKGSSHVGGFIAAY